MALTEGAALVLLSAGQGSRAGGQVPKQFAVHRSGHALVVLGLRRALAAGAWGKVVAVAPPEGVDRLQDALVASGIADATVVQGGIARVDSMANGLAAIDAAVTPVCVVHDGTRPFTPPEIFTSVLAEVCSGRVEAAWPGGRPANTLFDTSGGLPRLLPPGGLLTAATPIAALTRTASRVLAHTGERERALAALLVSSGVTWTTVPDSPLNFKVTTPEDLELAVRMEPPP